MPDASPFRPRARIIRTLGADLISSDRVALIELVKNAHDADASLCVIAYHPEAETGPTHLSIFDDGHGMNLQELTSGWLELAGTRKVHTRRSETKDRPLLGEKGVGRLAAARLGRELLVSTRRAESTECQLLIDWTQFDDAERFLDEIEVELTDGESDDITSSGRAAQLLADAGLSPTVEQGTLLAIGEPETRWDREAISEIRTALQRLVAPAPDASEPDFRIVLVLPDELDDLAGEVRPPDFTNEPLYRVKATVDEKGRATYTIDGHHPNLTARSGTLSMWERRDRPPECGPFSVEIRAWDLDRAGAALAAPTLGLRDFRKQLSVMAGVSVYRDGFRVFPYGERGDDWLGLGLRRINQPSERMSNNQVIGFVHLTGDGNPLLHDQSNREGLIDNTAAEDLRILVRNVLVELETDRRALRRTERPARPQGGLFDAFDMKGLTADLRSRGADTAVIQAVEQQADLISDAVKVVQDTLARFHMHVTLGQLVDRVVHDGRTAVAPLRSKADRLRRALSSGEASKISTGQDELLSSVDGQTELLVSLFDGLDPLSGRKRGRPANVSAFDTLHRAVDASDRGLCHDADITIVGDDTTVRWAKSDIIVAVVNLINNALYWLNREPPAGDPVVQVRFERLSDAQVLIRVSDNGPGVPAEHAEHIFDSYFSRKPDGLGLGLAIVGSTAASYGGALRLAPSELGGATFELLIGRHV